MPRLHSITLNALRADQLHQLALEDYRSVQQQASYLLDRAIAQAIQDRARANDQECTTYLEPDHAPSSRETQTEPVTAGAGC